MNLRWSSNCSGHCELCESLLRVLHDGDGDDSQSGDERRSHSSFALARASVEAAVAQLVRIHSVVSCVPQGHLTLHAPTLMYLERSHILVDTIHDALQPIGG